MDTHDELPDVSVFPISRPHVQRYKILPRNRLRVPIRTRNNRHPSNFSSEQSERLLSITSDSESDPDLYDANCDSTLSGSKLTDGPRWDGCNTDRSVEDSDLNLIPPRVYRRSSKLSCCSFECNLM
ncbi:hypothetical protein AAHC03_05071 [Spirometra sp. Aus1]|nr:unnamed protein product [Spirometra erinaceieuropaei]